VFTGIVSHQGRIARIRPTKGEGRRLEAAPSPAMEGVRPGDSIAVDGVCLAFDVVPETLRRTTLGERRDGDEVNLERALRQGDEMGGHLVQGHVEGVGVIEKVDRHGEDVRMAILVPAALFGGVIPKGSIAVDGVSLTIGEVEPGDGSADGVFSVYLVPHTLAVTGLGRKGPGDRVNVEPDVMGRWVEHHVRRILGREDR
jgi:riboflavin synthase